MGFNRKSSTEKRNINNYKKWRSEMRAANRDPKPDKKPAEYGPKMQIQVAYRANKNIEDAYKKAEEINKKIGEDVYSKEMVDSWVAEERKKENRDDDYAL